MRQFNSLKTHDIDHVNALRFCFIAFPCRSQQQDQESPFSSHHRNPRFRLQSPVLQILPLTLPSPSRGEVGVMYRTMNGKTPAALLRVHQCWCVRKKSPRSSLPLNEACPRAGGERESRIPWEDWIPAYAGMTNKSVFRLFTNTTILRSHQFAEDLKSSFRMAYFFISLWSCLVVTPAAFAESFIFPLC